MVRSQCDISYSIVCERPEMTVFAVRSTSTMATNHGEHFLRRISREKSFKSPQNHLSRKAETCMEAFSVSLDSSLFKS